MILISAPGSLRPAPYTSYRFYSWDSSNAFPLQGGIVLYWLSLQQPHRVRTWSPQPLLFFVLQVLFASFLRRFPWGSFHLLPIQSLGPVTCSRCLCWPNYSMKSIEHPLLYLANEGLSNPVGCLLESFAFHSQLFQWLLLLPWGSWWSFLRSLCGPDKAISQNRFVASITCRALRTLPWQQMQCRFSSQSVIGTLAREHHVFYQ